MPNDRPADRPLTVTRSAASGQRTDATLHDVDAAIARVLAAEAAARDDTASATHEAATIEDEARRRVREIGERTERRIRAARARYESAVARELARLEAEAAAQQDLPALDDADRARVPSAVTEVAAELTS